MVSYNCPMRNRCRDGFTLLELMVVFVLIAIMGALAIPRIRGTSYKVDAGARVVQAAMQQGQRSAVQRQSNVVVSIDTVNNRVRTWNDVNNNNQLDTGEDARWRPLEEGNRFAKPPKGVNGGTPVSSVVSSNAKVSTDGFPSVIFRRDGAASGNIEVYLRSSTSDSNDYRAILVSQATGRVDMYRYGGNVWRRAR